MLQGAAKKKFFNHHSACDIGVSLILPPSHYPLQSVQFSLSVMSDSLRPHESQHARPPCPSPSPGVHSDYPLTQSNNSSASSWISFSVLELYINGIMKYILFRVWLLSFKKYCGISVSAVDSFYFCVVFHCMSMLQSIYPFSY